jgi:hypothetical protein
MVKTLLAQVDIGTEFKLGEKPVGQVFPDLGSLISDILPNIYVLVGIILFLLLIAGGYGIMMGAGSGESQKVGQGQKAVTAAIIGFIIIFASYWIIQIIEVVTGVNIFKSGI